jgi:ribokinase
VVGAVNVDLVVVAPTLPAPGETVVGGGLQTYGGGKGANAAVAAARVGAAVKLIAAVGDDDHGRAALAELAAEGVDVEGVAVLSGESTGVALIVVDDSGENQIAVGAGANAAIDAVDVRRRVREAASTAGCVLVSTEIAAAAVTAAVDEAVAASVLCVLNPAPALPVVADLLSRGVIVTPNETELGDIVRQLGETATGVAETDAAMVVARSGKPVVVTRGGEGVVVVDAQLDAMHVAAPRVLVRDTTGAGDTFNGVLAARLAAGDQLDEAVSVAVEAAALSVTEVGARGGMPTAAAVAAAMAG